MAHLVMIESWTLSSGLMLPQAIRELGHRYTLVCSDPARYSSSAVLGGAHPVTSQAHRIVQTDTNDVAKTIAALEVLHNEDPFDGAITSCDYYLQTVARVAEHFGLPGPSAATVQVANTKHLMREALRRAGMGVPSFAVATDWDTARQEAERIGFPLIVKPVDLCASQFVSSISNEEELFAAYTAIRTADVNARGQARLPMILLESVLQGPEFSVETVSFEGRTRVVGITDKSLVGFPNFVESGHMFPARLEAGDTHAIEECAIAALAAVGYDIGVAHVEIKLTPEGARIVEINTRVGGNWIAQLVRMVRGDDLLGAMVCCALGQTWRSGSQAGNAGSAAIVFLTAERDGRVEAVEGWEALSVQAGVVECKIRPDLVGRQVQRPRNNDDYLGYVICTGSDSEDARSIAERHLANVHLQIADLATALVPDILAA